MFSCCRNVCFEKVLFSGVIYAGLNFLIRQTELLLTMKYYLMHEYFGAWSLVIMPALGSTPPAKFFILSLLASLLSGIILALFYEFVKSLLKKPLWEFTCLLLALSLIFFFLPSYLFFNIPFALLIYWFFSQTIIFFITSLVFIKTLN